MGRKRRAAEVWAETRARKHGVRERARAETGEQGAAPAPALGPPRCVPTGLGGLPPRADAGLTWLSPDLRRTYTRAAAASPGPAPASPGPAPDVVPASHAPLPAPPAPSWYPGARALAVSPGLRRGAGRGRGRSPCLVRREGRGLRAPEPLALYTRGAPGSCLVRAHPGERARLGQALCVWLHVCRFGK